MMDRYELFVSARDAEALATMLAAHRRDNPFEADASDELADLLMEARLVPGERLPDGCIALRSTVTYEEQPSGKRRTVTLVLPQEADASKSRVSVLSPIGLALIGRKPGAQVTAQAGNGRELVVRGAEERLAPILMTALATGLALVPIVLGGSRAGYEIEHPLAVVILGGLVTSTLLNLFIVPSLYLRYARPAIAIPRNDT